MPAAEDDLKAEVDEILGLTQRIENEEQALMQIPEVAAFFKRKKEVDNQIAEFWKRIEQQMIDAGVKSIKGEWGSLTIAEKLDWVVTNELPTKFYKKVVDTKKLSDTYRLEGKAPKGAFPEIKKYLTKRFK